MRTFCNTVEGSNAVRPLVRASSQYCGLSNSHLWITGFVSKSKYHQVIENQFCKVGQVGR